MCVFQNKQGFKADLRIFFALELPRLREGRQGSEGEGLVLTHQLTLHLLGETDGVGAPLEGGRTSRRLRQQLRGAAAGRLVAGEQDGGLTLGCNWNRDGALDSRRTSTNEVIWSNSLDTFLQ